MEKSPKFFIRLARPTKENTSSEPVPDAHFFVSENPPCFDIFFRFGNGFQVLLIQVSVRVTHFLFLDQLGHDTHRLFSGIINTLMGDNSARDRIYKITRPDENVQTPMTPYQISYGTSDSLSLPSGVKELLTLNENDGIAWFFYEKELKIEFFLNRQNNFKGRTVIGSCTLPYQLSAEESKKVLKRKNILYHVHVPEEPIRPDATYLSEYFSDFLNAETRNFSKNRNEALAIIEAFCDAMYRDHKAPLRRWTPALVKRCILEDLATNPHHSQWDDEMIIPLLCRFFNHLRSSDILPRAHSLSTAAMTVNDVFHQICQSQVQKHATVSHGRKTVPTGIVPASSQPVHTGKRPGTPVPISTKSTVPVPLAPIVLPFGALLHNPLSVETDVNTFVDSSLSNPVISEEVKRVYTFLVKSCNSFCDLHPDLQIREGCLQLVNAFASKTDPPSPLLSGRSAIWGAGIVFATCQATGFTAKKNRLGVTADEVAGFFQVAPTAPTVKAAFIKQKIQSDYLRFGGKKPKRYLTDIFDPTWAECFRTWAEIVRVIIKTG